MAPRMRQWAGLLGSALAFIAIGQLPPEAYTGAPAEPLPHEEIQLWKISQEIRQIDGILRQNALSDELTADLFENSKNGLGLRGEGAMTSAALEDYRNHIEQGLASLPIRDPDALVGLYWVDIGESTHLGEPRNPNRATTEYYIGEREGKAYCMDVHAAVESYLIDERLRGRNTVADRLTYGSGVGACRLVAQYGMPGAQILEWLEAGALAFAYATEVDYQNRERYRGVYSRARAPFRGMWYRVNQLVEFDQCMAGQAKACLYLALNPINQRLRPDAEREIELRSALTTAVPTTQLLGAGAFLIGDLERDFGHEAFDTFWRSDLEVTDAFVAAFGVTMGDWLVGWAGDNLGRFQPGPGLTKSAQFGGLLTIMLFGLIAGLRNRRREVA